MYICMLCMYVYIHTYTYIYIYTHQLIDIIDSRDATPFAPFQSSSLRMDMVCVK